MLTTMLFSSRLAAALPNHRVAECDARVQQLQAELDKARAELQALRAFPDCARVAVAMGCSDSDVPALSPATASIALEAPAPGTSPAPDPNFKNIKPSIEYGTPIAANDYSHKVVPKASSSYFPGYPLADKLIPPGAMQARKMLDEYSWQTVADVGSGKGDYSRLFHHHNKTVTSYELGRRYGSTNASDFVTKGGTVYGSTQSWRILMGNFMCAPTETYDALWVHHVMEHMLDPHIFVSKLFSMLKEGGVLALTVPPLKSQIVGGHVSIWCAGLLIQHLIRAGFDCRYLRLYKHSYSIGLLLQKRSIPDLARIPWKHDRGDICQVMAPYLPIGLKRTSGLKRGGAPSCLDAFEGNLRAVNWE